MRNLRKGKKRAHLFTCGRCDLCWSPSSRRSSDTESSQYYWLSPHPQTLWGFQAFLTFHVPCERLASKRLWAPRLLHAEQHNHMFSSKAHRKLFSKNRMSLFDFPSSSVFLSLVTNGLFSFITNRWRGFNFLLLSAHKTSILYTAPLFECHFPLLCPQLPLQRGAQLWVTAPDRSNTSAKNQICNQRERTFSKNTE